MYKLLALDMDGTLLRKDATISEKSINAIGAARKKGIKVVLCTGRPLEGIEKYLHILNLVNNDDYSVTCTGAVVQNNTKDKLISNICIGEEDLRFLYNMARQLDLDISFLGNGKYSVSKEISENLYTIMESKTNSSLYEVVNFETILKYNYINKATLINEHQSVAKELFKSTYTNISKYNDFRFREKKFNKELFVTKNNLPTELLERFTAVAVSNYALEVTSKEANKGIAVERLCDYLNIPINEAICIGDSGNDIHMIQSGAFGVAMGNATEELKKAADYITLTNDEDGVAHVIEKFIL